MAPILMEVIFPRNFTPKDFTQPEPIKVSPSQFLIPVYGCFDGQESGQHVFLWVFNSQSPAEPVPLPVLTSGRGHLYEGDSSVWLVGWQSEPGKRPRQLWQRVGDFVPYHA